MTHFADLTPYTYLGEEPGTVNVGWLDQGQPFPTGDTSSAFRESLRRLCEMRVNQTRGFHECPFCTGNQIARGSAEIRVAGTDKVYAAPTLLHHYVVEHRYRPPDDFIAAVFAWEENHGADHPR